MHGLEFRNELVDLRSLAFAKIKKADADGVLVAYRLNDPAQAERQTLKAKLDLDARVDAAQMRFMEPDAAAGGAEVDDAALKTRTAFDHKDDCGAVDRFPALRAPFTAWAGGLRLRSVW